MKKFISVFITICLLVSYTCSDVFAAYIINPVEPVGYNQINNKFILPSSLGKITEAHFAATDRVIINIQDLHCHPKVQKNISGIIELFDKKIPINNIYLEGAYGDIDVSWLIKAKNLLGLGTVDKILDTGRITGAEYYCALNEKNEIIKGLENKEEYLDNIKRFTNILNNREKISIILNSISETTDNLKKTYYNKRQLKIDDLSKQYNEGKITAEKYFYLLSKHIEKLNIDISKYTNISGYINLLTLQKDLNYPKITKQLKSLLYSLKKILPADKYLSLVKASGNFSKIDNLYEYLVDIIGEYNIDLSNDFQDLNKYFMYIKLSNSVNPLELIEEDKLLANEINARFSNTKAQREVLFLAGFERFLNDFLNAKITETNYKYFKNNLERYKQLWSKYVDNTTLNLLEEYIEQNSLFYEVNEKRNIYFSENLFGNDDTVSYISDGIVKTGNDIENIINNLKYAKKVDIVVTGGFHTGAISELLKEKNISYIVITPKIREGINLAEETYNNLVKEQTIIQTQTIAALLNSIVGNNIDLKVKLLLAAGLSNDNIKIILPEVTNDEIDRVKDIDSNSIGVERFFDKNEFGKIVKIAELLDTDYSSSNIIQTLIDFLFFYLEDDSLREEIDSDLILNYLDLDNLKENITSVDDIVKKAVEKRYFLNDSTKIKIYKIFVTLFNKLPVKFLSNKIAAKLNEHIVKNEVMQIVNENYNYLGNCYMVKPLSGGFQNKVPMKVSISNKNDEITTFVLKPISRNYMDLKRNPDLIADGISFADKNNIPTSSLHKTKDGKNYVEIGNYFYMLNDFAKGSTVNGNDFEYRHVENVAVALADTHNKFRNKTDKDYNDVKDWDIDKDINPELFDFSKDFIDKKLEDLDIINLTQDLNLTDEESKYILYFNHLWKDEEILKNFLMSEDERTIKFLIEQAKKMRRIWNTVDKNKLEKLFIHGDWNAENIFFDDNNNVVSLIDWEQYSMAYRIMDFYRFFVDTRYVNLFDVDKIFKFISEYQNNTDNPLNDEELNAMQALMIFGFVSRAKYVVVQDNEDDFFYNVKTFDDFFSENKITDILTLDEKSLKNALSKVINYPKKNMTTINRLKKSIQNNEPISISFVCLLNKHRSASAHLMFEYYLKMAGKDKVKINSFGLIPLVTVAGKFFEYVKNNKLLSKMFNLDYHDDVDVEVENYIQANDENFDRGIFESIKRNFKSENLKRRYANADYIVTTSKVQKMLLQIFLGKSVNVILFSDISIAMPDNSNLADPGRSHISMEQMFKLMYTSVKYLVSGKKDTGYKGYEQVTNNSYEKPMDNLVEQIVFAIFFTIEKTRNFFSRLQNISIFTLNSKADIIEPEDLFLIENEIWKEDLRRRNYNVATVSVINGDDEINRYYNWKTYKKTGINIKYKEENFRVYVRIDENKIEDIVFYSKNKVDNIDFEQLKKKLQQKKQEGFTSKYFPQVNNFIFANGTNAQELEEDIINKVKVNITNNSFVQAIEGVLNISDREVYIDNAVADAVSNNIGVIVINEKQLKDNKSKIESAQKKFGLKFILSSNSDKFLTDKNKIESNGNRIDAAAMDYFETKKLLEDIYELNIDVSTRISVAINNDVLSEFKSNDIDIFQKYGVIPIVNINNINIYSGKCEFEIKKEDIDKFGVDKLSEILVKNENIISLSVDDVLILYNDNGTDGIKEEMKDLQNGKKNYTKGLVTMLKSEFIDDFVIEEKIDKAFFDNNKFLKDILINDFTQDTNDNVVKINNFINLLQNSSFFKELPKAAQIYLTDTIEAGNYTQTIGAVRGILMNTVEKQMLKDLKRNNKLNVSVIDFRKKLEYDYRLAYLTLNLRLIIDGKQKENMEFIEDSVADIESNANKMIRQIVRENTFSVEPVSDELFKNYDIIEDIVIGKLENYKVNAEIQSSIQNIKKIFAAA